MNHQRKRWVFTLNNYTDVEQTQIRSHFGQGFDYLVFGREVGQGGTPHLQGFFVLSTRKRLGQVRAIAGFERAHLEGCRGTPLQASTYCKKEGDFEEFGTLPAPGRRTDFEALRDWIKEQSPAPSELALAENFPSLYGRYPRACDNFVRLFGERPVLIPGDAQLRQWQQRLLDVLNEPPGDRTIIFVVDANGNTGKSWFVRYMLSTNEHVQRLSVGKRDDLAFAIDVSKTIFLFDIPRGQSEYLQYSVLEQLKDRLIFSPKYQSSSKVLLNMVHVVVFMNEGPDLNSLSQDRYNIIYV